MSRGSTAAAAFTVGICLSFGAVSYRGCNDSRPVPPSFFDKAPLSIILDVQGDGKNMPFHASMNSAGDTEVSTGLFLQVKNTTRLDAETRKELRRLLKQKRFFTFRSTIGRPTPSGATIVFTVVLENHSHTVLAHVSSGTFDGKEGEGFKSLYNAMVESIMDQLSDVELNRLE